MTDDRFIELLLKDFSGELHQEERDELEIFLNKEDYRKRYKIYKMYWSEHGRNSIDNSAMFRKVKQKIRESGEDGREEEPWEEAQVRPLRSFRWQRVAAVILLALSSLFLYRTLNVDGKIEQKTGWLEKTTERASKISFSLPDGSRITLNSASKLRFPPSFNGKTREVYLSGEAFFDIKKDPLHPFVIHAGKMNVRVLGTAFNVKAYPNEPTTETTLIRGAVEVTLKDRPSDKIILKPSEKLIVNYSLPRTEDSNFLNQKSSKQGNALTQITYMQKQDTTVVETSWVQNKLIFKDEDFAEVGRSMERWFNMNIHFANDELKKLRFSATFENETIDQALNALQITDPFHYKIEGRTVYIY